MGLRLTRAGIHGAIGAPGLGAQILAGSMGVPSAGRPRWLRIGGRGPLIGAIGVIAMHGVGVVRLILLGLLPTERQLPPLH